MLETFYLLCRIIYREQKAMIRKIIAVLVSAGVLLGILVAPAYAQDSSTSTVSACNQAAKNSLKNIREQFKAGSITKDQRNAQLKEVEKTRRVCVKTALEARRLELKAKAAAAKAVRDARKAERKAAN